LISYSRSILSGLIVYGCKIYTNKVSVDKVCPGHRFNMLAELETTSRSSWIVKNQFMNLKKRSEYVDPGGNYILKVSGIIQ